MSQVLADEWMKANGKTYVKVEPKAVTNLSADEAYYWERRIYDRELAGGAKVGNLQVPYSDEKMTELIKKHCPK